MKKISFFLIALALVVGVVGCGGGGNGGNGDTLPQNLEIYDWYDLDVIRDNLGGAYVLMNDLDSTTVGYEELAGPMANGGSGWRPIGSHFEVDYPFKGIFDGQGYEICDLFIDRFEGQVALFNHVDEGGVIQNVGVVNVTISGAGGAGGLVGGLYTGIVSNSYSTGSVTGSRVVGGLLGYNLGGTVSNSHSTCSVIVVTGWSWDSIGGLVGSSSGTVINSYSTGSVTVSVNDTSGVGGLVGENSGIISNSYSTSNLICNATGCLNVGGLVGESLGGNVTNSYSSGSVTGRDVVGGLVGVLGTSTVSNSYSTGSVSGDERIGGLVGAIIDGTVINSYSTGSVTGGVLWVGGLAGVQFEGEGIVANSFWDTETSGQSASAGGTGKTTAEMQDITTFSGATWDIVGVANPDIRNLYYIWNIVDGETYPFLSWEP